MPTLIHIPKSNTRYGITVSVGVNGKVTRIPVGQDYIATDGEYEALTLAGIPLQLRTIPSGMIAIPSTPYGQRVAIGINGVVSYLPTGIAFTPTAAQLAALNALGISYSGNTFPANVLAFSNGDHPVFSDGTYLRFAA